MLKREDLEHWSEPSPDSVDRIMGEILALRDAAPKLALACLSALEVAAEFGLDDLCVELYDALAAAGVEVE